MSKKKKREKNVLSTLEMGLAREVENRGYMHLDKLLARDAEHVSPPMIKRLVEAFCTLDAAGLCHMAVTSKKGRIILRRKDDKKNRRL